MTRSLSDHFPVNFEVTGRTPCGDFGVLRTIRSKLDHGLNDFQNISQEDVDFPMLFLLLKYTLSINFLDFIFVVVLNKDSSKNG